MTVKDKLESKIFGDTTLQEIIKESYTRIQDDRVLIRESIKTFNESLNANNITLNQKATAFTIIVEGMKRLENLNRNMVNLITAINSLFLDADAQIDPNMFLPLNKPMDEEHVANKLRTEYGGGH